jgi:hypothetical protein
MSRKVVLGGITLKPKRSMNVLKPGSAESINRTIQPEASNTSRLESIASKTIDLNSTQPSHTHHVPTKQKLLTKDRVMLKQRSVVQFQPFEQIFVSKTQQREMERRIAEIDQQQLWQFSQIDECIKKIRND